MKAELNLIQKYKSWSKYSDVYTKDKIFSEIIQDLELLEEGKKEYAKLKCKEQRELCAKEITDGKTLTAQRTVLRAIKQVYKAPEPNFD